MSEAMDEVVQQEPPPVFFNVTSRNKFQMSITKCTDLLQLSDNFLREEEVKQLVNGFHSYRSSYQILREDNIRSTLHEWTKLIKKGKASTRCTTPEIEELIGCIPTYQLNDYIDDPYYVSSHTVYNRDKVTYKHKGRVERILQRDVRTLCKLCNRIINQKVNVELEFKYVEYNGPGYIRLAKKVHSWRDIEKYIKTGKRSWGLSCDAITNADKVWMKKIWDEPALAKTPFR